MVKVDLEHPLLLLYRGRKQEIIFYAYSEGEKNYDATQRIRHEVQNKERVVLTV